MTKKLSDYIEECKNNIETGWFIATLSDEYIVDTISELDGERHKLRNKENKLLEIRAFNDKAEYKLFRTHVAKDGANFLYREINDSDLKSQDFYDELQILDVDMKQSGSLTDDYVVTTGGGKYHLPLKQKNNARVRIRYYVQEYASTGQARVADWRIVELMEGC